MIYLECLESRQQKSYLRSLQNVWMITCIYLICRIIPLRFHSQLWNGLICRKNVLTDAANEVMKVVYEEDRRMLAKHLADICEGRENVHNLHYRWLDKEGMPVWINSVVS